MRFPVVVIVVTAITWAGFAVWLGTNPGALLPAFGVDQSSPQMLTEVRAFYGGVELAIAVSMLLLLRYNNLFAALLVGGLPLFGAVFGRIAGLALDGFSASHVGFAALELTGAAFCVAGALVESRTSIESRVGERET
ncbi:MAG: DUF4345 family protein [Planctomycetota bacterium]